MAVSISYSLLDTGNLETNFDSSPAITGLSTGGFLTAGEDPFTIPAIPPLSPITINNLNAQDYGADGTGQGGLATSSIGLDPSIVQLDRGALFAGPTPNVVIAYTNGDQVAYRLLDTTGANVGAATGIGDTNTSNADVAVLNGFTSFSGGFLTFTPGGFVIAYQDSFSATDSDVELRFYNNSGTETRLRAIDTSVGTLDTDPQVVQLDNGNVAVTWMRTTGSATSVHYAITNRDGSVVVKSSTVLDETGNTNRDPVIVATDAGFAILYKETSTTGVPPLQLTTQSIKMVSLDSSGNELGARTLVSSPFGTLNDIDAVRMADGLLAFTYTSASALLGGDSDILLRVTGQAHDSTVITDAVEVVGAGDTTRGAAEAALASYGTGRLAAIYHDTTNNETQGDTFTLTRTHTGDGADDVMTGATLLFDAFVGGGGTDTVDYSAATTAVKVDLSAGVGTGGIAAGDTYSSIENVTGGSGNDTLFGSGGANTLVGEDGNDLITGFTGNDALFGRLGNDSLYGGDGTDTLVGNEGDDFLFGGTSAGDLRDLIYGGDGNDSADGGAGNDELNGGNGNDTLVGDLGADTLAGNNDNDLLAGGGGADFLFGNAGNDTLNGGFGYDRLNGGAGADKFFHQGVADHGSDWVQDYSAAQGDVLQFGIAGATKANFQVNYATTPGAGAAGVTEAFVIYKPTGQILWALIDGGAQAHINVQSGGQVFDLLI